ncbi:MAG: nicotinamide mononucleotide transporter [Candidatus Paceibacterota bacterium]
MNIFVVIEIIGSILYFSQKIFLSLNKRVGWILGFLGSIAFTIVTLHKGSFSYSILEITSGIIFIFGMFAWKKNNKLQNKITILMSFLTLIGIIIVFFLNLRSPNWILENLMVILFSIGAVFLVLRKPIGWILYILGHLVLIYYGYILGTYYISILQIISLPFAVIGYRNLKNGIIK